MYMYGANVCVCNVMYSWNALLHSHILCNAVKAKLLVMYVNHILYAMLLGLTNAKD